MNLVALHMLLPNVELTGVEINENAYKQVAQLPYVEAHNCSFYDFEPMKTYDLVFTKTVLIHQSPEALPDVYDLMYKLSGKYILVAEYHNPTPVEVVYRGNSGVLFKRDFAGELLDRFQDLVLENYGFVYHRDVQFPQDDVVWFLLKKG